MAHSKAFLFIDPEEINHIIAGYGKALGYPARIIIMRWLAAEGPRSAGEITKYIGLSKATTSHHLSCLERAGIIEGSERGSNIIYSFNPLQFMIMRDYIDGLFEEIANSVDKTGAAET